MRAGLEQDGEKWQPAVSGIVSSEELGRSGSARYFHAKWTAHFMPIITGRTNMAMHTPSAWTFWLSVVLVVIAILSWFVHIPYLSPYTLWIAVIGYIVLVVGCKIKTT
jgi:hypothetical protein